MLDAISLHELSDCFDKNPGPLGNRVSGNPCVTKVTYSFSMTADDIVHFDPL